MNVTLNKEEYNELIKIKNSFDKELKSELDKNANWKFNVFLFFTGTMIGVLLTLISQT